MHNEHVAGGAVGSAAGRGEVRLRDVAVGRGKRQKRAAAAGQGSVEGGAGTADGVDESVSGARETGGMETQNLADRGTGS